MRTFLIFLLFLGAETQASNITQFFGSSSSGGGAQKLKSIQYTTAGTFTWVRPAGVEVVSVSCWGGGGGGAGGSSSCSTSARSGAGGASGYYATLDYVKVSGDVVVTIGAGGAGGAAGTSGAVGSAGQDSTFGNFLRAAGGPGGGVSHTALSGIGIAMSPSISGVVGSTSSGSCASTQATSSPKGSASAVAGGGQAGSGAVPAAICCWTTIGYDAYNYPISGNVRYPSGTGGSAGFGDGGAGGAGGTTGSAGGVGGNGAGGGGGGSGATAAAGGAGGPGMCQVTWLE